MVLDKTGRKIHLTKERWKHITTKHPYMTNYLEGVKETTTNFQNTVPHLEGDLFDYYRYYKHRKEKAKFLNVVVKYLNRLVQNQNARVRLLLEA